MASAITSGAERSRRDRCTSFRGSRAAYKPNLAWPLPIPKNVGWLFPPFVCTLGSFSGVLLIIKLMMGNCPVLVEYWPRKPHSIQLGQVQCVKMFLLIMLQLTGFYLISNEIKNLVPNLQQACACSNPATKREREFKCTVLLKLCRAILDQVCSVHEILPLW